MTMIKAYSKRALKGGSPLSFMIGIELLRLRDVSNLPTSAFSRAIGLKVGDIDRITRLMSIPSPNWWAKANVMDHLRSLFPDDLETLAPKLVEYIRPVIVDAGADIRIDGEIMEQGAQGGVNKRTVFPNPNYPEMKAIDRFPSFSPQALCIGKAFKLISSSLKRKKTLLQDILHIDSDKLGGIYSGRNVPAVSWMEEKNVLKDLRKKAPKFLKKYGRIIEDYIEGRLPDYTYETFKKRYPSVMEDLLGLVPASSAFSETPASEQGGVAEDYSEPLMVFVDPQAHHAATAEPPSLDIRTIAAQYPHAWDSLGREDALVPLQKLGAIDSGDIEQTVPSQSKTIESKSLRSEIAGFIQENYFSDPFGDPVDEQLGHGVLGRIKQSDPTVLLSQYKQAIKTVCRALDLSPDRPEAKQAKRLIDRAEKLELS